MRTRPAVAGLTATAGVAVLALIGAVPGAAGASPAEPFPDARLKIEYNATDGDAGLQVFVDAPAWKHISITNPKGEVIVDVDADRAIRNYGLTELFSESSEPPFTEFPFARFKRLFPAGTYSFRGETIDGQRLASTVKLTHQVPDGPVITAPQDGSTVSANGLEVTWEPVTTPAGIDVVAYQVVVVDEADSLGNPQRVLEATLPGTADHLTVPPEFLPAGEYKTEVLAIERSGNQTLTEVAFAVAG